MIAIFMQMTQIMYGFGKDEVADINSRINLELKQHSFIINPSKSKQVLFEKPSKLTLREEAVAKLSTFISGGL